MATKRIRTLRDMFQAAGLALAGTAGLASGQAIPGPAATPAAPVSYDGTPLSAVPQDAKVALPTTSAPSALPPGTVLGGPMPAGAMPMPGMVVQGDGMVGGEGCATCGLFAGTSPGSCDGMCHKNCDVDKWLVQVDALALFRGRGRSLSLAGVQGVLPNGPIDLRSQSGNYSTAPGGRVFIGHTLPKISNCDMGWEIGYFGSASFNTRKDQLTAPVGGRLLGGQLDILNNENGGTGSPGFLFNRTAIDARNDSSIHSLEGNFKLDYYLDGSTVLLAGPRYIRVQDNLDVAETGFVSTLPVAAFRHVRIVNNMLGFQLGGEFNRRLGDRLSLGLGMKFGVMGNLVDGRIEQASTYTSLGGYARSFDPSRTKASGMLEGGLSLTYTLKKHLNLHGGYQFLWLSNVGTDLRAPTPLFTGATDIGRLGTGGLVYHGLYAGLEWHWGCCN